MADLDAIRSRAACAYGTHDCDFDGCDGGGPWPIPWAVVDDIKGDGHWDNEFHVLTENGEGSGLATFEYRPHAELFANAVADIAALLGEVDRLREERDLAVAHDRQPYPTADAYERACEALRKHRAEVDQLRERVALLEAAMRDHTDCRVCRSLLDERREGQQ